MKAVQVIKCCRVGDFETYDVFLNKKCIGYFSLSSAFLSVASDCSSKKNEINYQVMKILEGMKGE